MAATNGVKIVFGGGAFMRGGVEQAAEWLKVLEELGIQTIDTARAYGDSEKNLGATGAPAKFVIDTKLPGGFDAEPLTAATALQQGQESLDKLQTSQVDVLYIHAPERRVPFKETLAGLDALHKQGAFRRLGLSNYLGHEVEEMVRVAKENGFVVPSVYQGNYSAVARRTEAEVMPVLRRHGLAFYAYSPIAGGFLAKTKESLLAADGRFGKDDFLASLYNKLYNRPSFVAALDAWAEIAAAEEAGGISRAELAYRWIFYHSDLRADAGDAVIVGASRPDQLRATVAAVRKGPLSADAARKIAAVWDTIKDDAPLDNYEDGLSK